MLMRERGKRLNIEDGKRGICERFAENRFRVGSYRLFHFREVGEFHDRYVHAHFFESYGKKGWRFRRKISVDAII